MIEASRELASFRDPAGFVFLRDDELYRQVNLRGRDDYDRLMQSGLYEVLADMGMLVRHADVNVAPWEPALAYKIVRPERVPFISYPYEWSFDQLKDAALLTLDIQRMSVERGMSLKDASAYNVQFRGAIPVFIDTLSFEAYQEGLPWVAYRQYCQHFLAPLALMSRVDIRLSQLLRSNLDGVPLDLASRLLPLRSRLNPGLLLHLHVHAKLQGSHSDRQAERPRAGFRKSAMLGLLGNLRLTVAALRWKPPKTEWGDYTTDNSYTLAAREHKHKLVSEFLDEIKPNALWDLGANTGEYSRLASSRGISTVAFDLDPACVQRNYQDASATHEKNLLPLLSDLTNPSPASGWECRERMSLPDRGPVDSVMALALVHHLAIVHNLPLPYIVRFFSRIARSLIIEFVPKDDVQVVRLLRGRIDIFDAYSQRDFETSFLEHFEIHRTEPLMESGRVLYRMERRDRA